MNAKTDRWEIYTDKAGRRHWRWPASSGASERDGPASTTTPGSARLRPHSSSRRIFAPLLRSGK